MFKQLKDLLPRTINKQGYFKEFEAIGVINEYKKWCIENFGEDGLKNLKPRYYKNNMLYISASGAMWAQQLSIKQSNCIEYVNKNIAKPLIKKLSITIVNNAD
ncbi:DUF721 domain-containing protein [bacterium]|nr:DUF721 domain-containing protein [bacterium]